MQAARYAIYGVLLFLTGFGTVGAWMKYEQKEQANNLTMASGNLTMRKMANGTVIFEAMPETQLQNIAPAAGEDANDPYSPIFKYDPFTQTYRAIGHRDILNTNDTSKK